MPKGSGRRPLPTAVKRARGNPGKRKPNDAEPSPAPGVPEMPAGLPLAAAEEWKRIVPELETLGVLTRVDRAALAAYCHAYARWFEAEQEVLALGIVVREPILIAGEPTEFCRYKKNPAVSISEGAMKLMKAFLVEFGMTPSSRSRIRVEKPNQTEDAMDQFLSNARAPADPAKRVN
jgi:P27 family predicted phage terminase small subunit